jgi:hypothetical protein
MMMRRLLVFAILFATSLVVFAGPARALDRNFAGSAQIDYHFVPGQHDKSARAVVFDGTTMELAFKVAVDFSDHLSANLKVCYGCHGFETDMAYFDYRVADELNFRLGRFSPSFGGFNLRHDPANHRLSDKPLAYDMGRMLRLREWNLGVLPSPFADNGIEVSALTGSASAFSSTTRRTWSRGSRATPRRPTSTSCNRARATSTTSTTTAAPRSAAAPR